MGVRIRLLVAAAVIASAVGYAAIASASSNEPVLLPTSDPWPIGALAFSPTGELYFVNQADGDIDTVVGHAIKTVLSVPNPSFEPVNKSIAGTEDLAVTSSAIWFTSNGWLYRASPDGRHMTRLSAVSGAALIEMLTGGTLLYSTDGRAPLGIYERSPDGSTRRVAGGGSLGDAAQLASTNRATSESIGEASGIGAVSPGDFYFTYENSLFHVKNEFASELAEPNDLDFFNGEIATRPSGVMDVICHWSVCQIRNGAITQLFRLPTRVDGGFVGPMGIAVSPGGELYESYTASTVSPKSAERGGIMRVSPTGMATVILEAKY